MGKVLEPTEEELSLRRSHKSQLIRIIAVATVIFLICFLLLISGCKKSDGDTARSISPDLNPEVPTLDWYEVSGACHEIITGYIWARYDIAIDRLYIFEDTGGCMANNSAALKLDPEECGTRSHYLYVPYEFCHSEETVDLMNINNVWLTVEEL